MTAMHTHSFVRYAKKSLSRAGMRMVLGRVLSWEPMTTPKPGYTIIIGCGYRLCSILLANLRSVSKQRAPRCAEVLLVFDCEPLDLEPGFQEEAKRACPNLPLRFVFYSAAQKRVTRAMDWGWAYAWASWSKGISLTTTKHAVLHDLDALLAHPDLLEKQYDAILARGVEYLGVGFYSGLGILPEDELCRTYELFFDAQFVRNAYKPVELFNAMGIVRGQRVEFDTFLHAQFKAGKRAVHPLSEAEMVHPSQMICQYTDFCAGRHVAMDNNNLLMLPYYSYLGGRPQELEGLLRDFRAGKRTVTLFGKPLDVDRIIPAKRAWMHKQIMQAERAFRPTPDADAAEYARTLYPTEEP